MARKHLKETSFAPYYYLELPKTRYEILLDLDGVLCDFDGQFQKLINYTPKVFETIYGTEAFVNEVLKFGTEFWSDMSWTADGRELWNYLKRYSPTILSTPLYDPKTKSDDISVEGKLEWIFKHLGKSVPYIFSKDKAKYASEYSLLIDDNIDNVRKFKEAGGHVILFKDSGSAIKQFTEFLEKFEVKK